MNKVDDGRLRSSIFFRSFCIYFEPVVNFFQTKYVNNFQKNELLSGGGQSQEKSDVVLSAALSEPAAGLLTDGSHLGAGVVQEKAIDFGAPEGDIECKLAAIWQDLLGVNSVSRQDDFFELGGNSLLSVRLLIEIQDRFQVAPPLAAFIMAGKLSEMALLISYQQIFAPLVVADDKVGSYALTGQVPAVEVQSGSKIENRNGLSTMANVEKQGLE